MSNTNTKQLVRQILRDRRKSFTKNSRNLSQIHEQFYELFCQHVDLKSIKYVAIYEPMGSEVRLDSIVQELYKHNIACLKPLMNNETLKLTFIDCQSLQPHKGDIDLFLVPLIGFDDQCHRLGQGKGYYDATLIHYPHSYKIGVAYECQEWISSQWGVLPTEIHDVTLDAVLTEKRFIKKCVF